MFARLSHKIARNQVGKQKDEQRGWIGGRGMGGATMLGIMRSNPCDAVNVVANAPVLSAP